MLFMMLIFALGIWGAAHLLLYGVSAWWKVNNTESPTESKTYKQRAIMLVATSFGTVALVITLMLNSMTAQTVMLVMHEVLKQAGITLPGAP